MVRIHTQTDAEGRNKERWNWKGRPQEDCVHPTGTRELKGFKQKMILPLVGTGRSSYKLSVWLIWS